MKLHAGVLVAVLTATYLVQGEELRDLAEAPGPQTEAVTKRPLHLGMRLRGGGRYDNVRACVATPAGVPGGPAADVAFVTQIGLASRTLLDIDLPVMRPILFASAFDMLQYEPSVTLEFSRPLFDRTDLFAGPTIGLSLHNGPDYESESSGPGRTASFFAMGPTLGGRLGVAFEGDHGRFTPAVSVSPYVTPLFGIDDPERHRGVVVGGMLDVTLRVRVR
jgi:hypothetical protein